MISRGNFNLYIFLNVYLTLNKIAPTLDMNFGVRPSNKVKLFIFNNIFLTHLILHFASFNIDLLLVAHSNLFHQQLGHLQHMFTFFGHILIALVKL